MDDTFRSLNRRAWLGKPDRKAKALSTDPALLPAAPPMPKGVVIDRQLLIEMQRAVQEGSPASLKFVFNVLARRLQ